MLCGFEVRSVLASKLSGDHGGRTLQRIEAHQRAQDEVLPTDLCFCMPAFWSVCAGTKSVAALPKAAVLDEIVPAHLHAGAGGAAGRAEGGDAAGAPCHAGRSGFPAAAARTVSAGVL